MKKPDIPACEPERLSALGGLNILDTPPEQRFDRITRIAKSHFQTPIALITLVDAERQWFKSRQNLSASQTPRDISFCGHAILSEDIFYIPNTLEDARFADNPLVTGTPNIRFYAGAPLHSPEAERIGTLCIIDDKPRQFTPQELSVLRDLADCVELELERTHLLYTTAANKRHQQRLNHLLQATPGVIYSCKAWGSFAVTYVSDKVEGLLGYTAVEVTSDPDFWFNHIHPDDRERSINELTALFSANDYTHEYRIRHASGHYCWVLDKRHVVRDAQGRLVEIVGLCTDITISKQADIELQASENRIRALVDTIVDGIIVIDSKGRIQTLNPAAVSLFGYTLDEVHCQNIKILMPQPYAREHDGYLHNYLTTGDKKVIGIGREVTGKRKDGSTFPMELAVSEMQVNGERMFTGIVRDISERKHAEQRLQSVTALRQAILDSANFSIISTDPDGLIQTFNRGAERMLGYSAEEMVGKLTPALLHDQGEIVRRAKELTAEFGETIEPGFDVFTFKARLDVPDEREWTYIRKDGSRLPVLLSITAVWGSDGKISGFLGIGSDITERKKMELMKSEFISTVSHELRTPLTSIRGALGLVLSKSAGQLSVKAQSMLEMAERNSERLTMLINDILDLEKIEAGRLKFEFKAADLAALAARALEDNDGYARKHQITLTLALNVTQAPVWADEHRLLQVLANLISNAVKYSPENGKVTVSVTTQDSGFRVAVRDHGAGIPVEFHHRIFQRFAQADSSDTREKGGTGLGLSITKAIVERHQGKIGYQTEAGVGTVFYVDLPAWQVVTETIEPASQTSGDRGVLV